MNVVQTYSSPTEANRTIFAGSGQVESMALPMADGEGVIPPMTPLTFTPGEEGLVVISDAATQKIYGFTIEEIPDLAFVTMYPIYVQGHFDLAAIASPDPLVFGHYEYMQMTLGTPLQVSNVDHSKLVPAEL